MEKAITLHSIYVICRSFDSVLEAGVGPNGKATLLNTPTGQVVITNVGCSILRCMKIDHPVGSVIIKSIASHHSYSGDGSKTFVLYLTSILGTIANTAEITPSIHQCEQKNCLSHALHYIRRHVLVNILLPTVLRKCDVIDVRENGNATRTVLHNLVKSHLCGKYTEAIRHHLSLILVRFLCSGLTDYSHLFDEVTHAIDKFNLLCIDVDSVPLLSCYIYEGIVIQRDFLNFVPLQAKYSHTRFVLVHKLFIKHGVAATYEAQEMSSLEKAVLLESRCSTALVDWLVENHVNLIFATGSIGDVLNGLCSKAGIATVHCVDEEDFERIQLQFQITPVRFMSDLSNVKPDCFISCAICEAKSFGQRHFVSLKLPEENLTDQSFSQMSCGFAGPCYKKCNFHTVSNCLKRQLVICCMSAGACQQVRLELLYALKMLRQWLDTNWLKPEKAHCKAVTIAGGGTFELICYDAVRDFMKQNALQLTVPKTVCCEALCSALLAIPLRLLRNCFNPNLASLVYIEEKIKSSQNICGFDGHTGHELQADVVESLSSKMVLLDHVLQLTEQLVGIHSIVYIRKLVQNCV